MTEKQTKVIGNDNGTFHIVEGRIVAWAMHEDRMLIEYADDHGQEGMRWLEGDEMKEALEKLG